MITSSREGDFVTKQEGNTDDGKNSKAPTSSSTTTPWSRLKDPRIVRVSRAFGGKDRHSKVCTVRGLRDRRVRLSVATAIQLYDLQDRLGLNQPSKVVDWLLDAAKHEINELPPLQMPPGNFGLDDHQLMLANHAVGSTASQSNREGVKINSSMDWDDPLRLPGSNFWNSNAKSKDVATKTDDGREDWSDHRNEEEKRGSHDLRGTEDADNVSSTNFFLNRPNQQASIPGLLNNAVPYNPIYRWDPSNFSLSQMGGLGYAAAQTEDFHNFNVVPLPLPSGSQVLVCPHPAGTTQPYFPSHVATSVELDPKQMSHFQMLMGSSSKNPSSSNSTITPTVPTTLYSIGQPMRPLHFSMVSKPFPSHQDGSSTANQSQNDDQV